MLTIFCNTGNLYLHDFCSFQDIFCKTKYSPEFIDLIDDVFEFEFDNYEIIDNIWQPKGKFISHKAIWNIIDELDLHLEVENSLGGFYETSCDVVQKINNYLWLSEKEALQ